MIEQVVLLPQALEDAAEAYHWYEQRSGGLGGRFLAFVEECVERIRKNPQLYERAYADYRRAVVRRFPYVVFYEYDAHTITIYAIFHTAQDPSKWRRRLKRD